MMMMIVMIMTRGERRKILIVQAPVHHHHKAQPQYVRMVQFIRKHFSYLAFVTYRQTYILPSNLPNFNHHCWRRHASNRHKHGNINIRNWSIANLPKNLHWFQELSCSVFSSVSHQLLILPTWQHRDLENLIGLFWNLPFDICVFVYFQVTRWYCQHRAYKSLYLSLTQFQLLPPSQSIGW